MSTPTAWRFLRSAVRVFRFLRCALDADTGEVQLVYAFDEGPDLIERLRIPGAPFQLDADRVAAAEQAVRLLHLIAGVSYFKAAPAPIRIDGYTIDAATAAFMQSVYENGLGEFAYQNGLSLRGKIVFPVAPGIGASAEHPISPQANLTPRELKVLRTRFGEDIAAADAAEVGRLFEETRERIREIEARAVRKLERVSSGAGSAPAESRIPNPESRALTAIGGGKDSLVSIEALRSLAVAQTVVWVGNAPLIRACAERTGLPMLNIERQLAPRLFEFNRQGAYNGHIPVTAVNSAILVLAAVLLGADSVVFSNERSASYGSLIPGTGEVNHQWSKGWAFEQAFAAQVRRSIAVDLHYYSLLRPLSELAVARQFARLDRYDAHFSSCNRNFHLLGERPASRWCGVCPKCRFVFLALAPFLPKPRLMGIFGRNLLDEPAQASGFDALLEYQALKPFECVGEGRESRAAMAVLGDTPTWREDALVARFNREIRPQLGSTDLDMAPLLLLNAAEHDIPAALWQRLDAHFRS